MSEKKKTIKNRSYLLWLICIVCMILAAAVITYVFTNLKQENKRAVDKLCRQECAGNI